MADQKSKRIGLRQTIERILGADSASIGFSGRSSERHTHALALGVETKDASSLGNPTRADFIVFTKDRSGEEAPVVPWGVTDEANHNASGAPRPDFVVVGLRGKPTDLVGDGPALVVSLDDEIPPELVRPLNGLRPDAVVIGLDAASDEAFRVAGLLRLGFFAGSIQAPVLVRTDRSLDRAQLEALCIVGIAGLLLTGSVVTEDHIGQIRSSIDAIDLKELRQRRSGDRERPMVAPFAPRRTEDADVEHEEERLP